MPGKSVLAPAEHHRGDGQVELVDEARRQVLADGVGAPAEPDVLPCRLRGSLQRRLDAVGHEVERRAALHRDRRRAPGA